jgi:single-strand DNA-binding protein
MSNFNLNKVILGGRLTADCELKQTPQGTSVCQFSIAVNRRTSKDQQQQADFINCVAWRNTAEFISKYFKKGSSICVSGSIQTRNWTDGNGNNRYATEVLVDEAFFVDGKNDSQVQVTTPHFEELSTDADLPF